VARNGASENHVLHCEFVILVVVVDDVVVVVISPLFLIG